MNFIKWTPELSLDHTLIDEQHQNLFKIVNQLIENINIDQEFIKKTLIDLKKYSEQHFEEEEAILAERNYPGLEDHKFEHRFFIRRITRFCKEVVEENQELSEKMLEFLADWVKHHTFEEDQDYKKYL
ncbi:bacteriohemerythrin [Ancylomarina sp. DW003]|nr:bacteriohemerythrin [Ancylomarina sp. DW003]MDE5421732.1 bacteriohemerythrin [Ancylomarina sp. DW003]